MQLKSGMLDEEEILAMNATYAIASSIEDFKPIKIPRNYFHKIKCESFSTEGFSHLPFPQVFLEFEKPFGSLNYSGCAILKHEKGVTIHLFSKDCLKAIEDTRNGFAVAQHIRISHGENVQSKDVGGAIADVLANIQNIMKVFSSDNVKIIKTEYRNSKKEKKKVKKGCKLPEHYYEIEVDGKRVMYDKDYQKGGRSLSYSFDVRGHFRTYAKTKKRIWIEPYRKGNGVYIPKSYKLTR